MDMYPDEDYTFTVIACIGDYEDDEDNEIIRSQESVMSDIYDEDFVDEDSAELSVPLNPEWCEDEDGINIFYYSNNYFGHYYIELFKDNSVYKIINDGEKHYETYYSRVINIAECGNGNHGCKFCIFNAR